MKVLRALLRGQDPPPEGSQDDESPALLTLRGRAERARGAYPGVESSEAITEASPATLPLPYWFLFDDWLRLSETYQVDFVLHGLPGVAK